MHIDDKCELIVGIAALQVEPEPEARVDQASRVRLVLVLGRRRCCCLLSMGHLDGQRGRARLVSLARRLRSGVARGSLRQLSHRRVNRVHLRRGRGDHGRGDCGVCGGHGNHGLAERHGFLLRMVT